jgi:hypothetical protein
LKQCIQQSGFANAAHSCKFYQWHRVTSAVKRLISKCQGKIS